MLSRFAHFLLKKNRNAALVAFLCSILPVFFGSISVIIVALVTLRKGARDGFFVLAWGVLPLLAQAYVDESYLFFATAVLAFMLVWGMAVLLRHFSSWSVLLEVCIFLGVCAVFVSSVFQSAIEQWWIQQINDYMQMAVENGFIQAGDKPSSAALHGLARIAFGVEVLLLILIAGMKLAVARWWEASFCKTIHFRQELLLAKFSRCGLLLFILLALTTLLSKSWLFLDALIPVVGLFIVAGLCMLHYWMQGYKYARLALMGFYIVLIIFPYIVVLPLIFGLVDSGLNLRVKLLKKEV